jgi:hypothetical protein
MVVFSNNPSLVVNGQVIPVFAGGSSATFTATAANFSTAQTATVTASVNGVSQSAIVSLVVPSSSASARLSSLHCEPGSVPAQSTTVCTASLSAPAPAGGTFVSVAGGSDALKVPDSIFIPAGFSSTTFNAKTGLVSTGHTAHISASLDGSSQDAKLTLDAAYRVRAGGSAYTDSMAQLWTADNSFSGGETCGTFAPIANTNDPALFQTCRTGAFSYAFPVTNGIYTVKLHFAEISQTAARQRLFNVAINGAPALIGFDIFAQAGASLTAADQSFLVSVSGGQILLQFTNGAVGQPLVNSIEIVPGIQRPRPTIRVHSGGGPYIDPKGRIWSSDAGFVGGLTSSTDNPIGNTTDAALYQTCRYGNFSYTWDVPTGDYEVILKFAEIAGTGAGQRLFNVSINSSPALTNFDVFSEAGGAMIAVDKSFPVSVTGGKLAIQFTGNPDSSNLPLVNAIEIVPMVKSAAHDLGR